MERHDHRHEDAAANEPFDTVTRALSEAVQCALDADSNVWLSADAANSTVHQCLRVACAEAHRHELRVEQVLILMKKLCLSHKELRLLRPVGNDERSIYERLVTALVSQYYAL